MDLWDELKEQFQSDKIRQLIDLLRENEEVSDFKKLAALDPSSVATVLSNHAGHPFSDDERFIPIIAGELVRDAQIILSRHDHDGKGTGPNFEERKPKPSDWSLPLQRFAAGVGIPLTQSEIQRLKELEIKNVADLWKPDILRRLERDGKFPRERALELLDRSRLAVASPKPEVMKQLWDIKSLNKSLHAIHRADTKKLAGALRGVNLKEVRQIQVAAGQAVGLMKESIAATAGEMASVRSGYTPFSGKVPKDIASLFPWRPTCGTCKACKSALSPGAYLADLLDFLADNVAGPPFIPWSTWEERFHQPFTKLSLDCDAIETQLRQAEIAIEVLDRFITSKGWDESKIFTEMGLLVVAGEPPARPTVLLDMFDAYLTELGTTRAEVAVAVEAADGAKLTELAGRLKLSEDEVRNSLVVPAAGLTPEKVGELVSLIKKAQPIEQATIALDRVRARFITALRDNLVRLALQADPTHRTAKALGNYLHIDLSADACEMTTRVAQAIATIHSFLLAFRLGREGVDGRWPIWQERRWRWMQSYGTWHAAMMVYLYPEDFAFPGVRRDQTTQFKLLRTVVEENPSPSGIKSAIAVYRDAFEQLPQRAQSVTSVDRRGFFFRTVPGALFFGELDVAGAWSGWDKQAFEIETLLGSVTFNELIYLFFTPKASGQQAEPHKKLKFTSLDPNHGFQDKLGDSDEIGSILPVSRPNIIFISGPDHLATYFLSEHRTFVGAFVDRHNNWHGSLRIPVPDWLETEQPFKAVGHLDGVDWFLALDKDGNLILVAVNDPTPSAPVESSDPTIVNKALNRFIILPGATFSIATDFQASPGHSAYDGSIHKHELVVVVGRGADVESVIARFTVGQAVAQTLEWKPLPYATSRSGGLASVEDLILWNTMDDYILLRPEAWGHQIVASGKLYWSGRLPLHPIRQGDTALDEYKKQQDQFFSDTDDLDIVRVYLNEWFFYIPLFIAQFLSDNEHYQEAIDWLHLVYIPYRKSFKQRLIYYGLRDSPSASPPRRDTLAWQEDPFDPHIIARQRPGALFRHVLLIYIGILLDWADRLFARDTSESTNRARELYELALELLGADKPVGDRCLPQFDMLKRFIRHKYSRVETESLYSAIAQLERIDDPAAVAKALPQVQRILEAGKPFPTRLKDLRNAVKKIVSSNEHVKEVTLESVLTARADSERWLKAERALMSMVVPRLDLGRVVLRPDPLKHTDGLPFTVPNLYLPEDFCVPVNPLLDTYRFRAESNLAKLRTCRNFGGLKRKLQPYVAAADPRQMVRQAAAGNDDFDLIASEPPPVYRYHYLLERARYFIAMAKSIEQATQTALERKEALEYQVERAKDDLKLAQAHVQLQEMSVSRAQDDLKLSQLQKDKVVFQRDHWDDLLRGDLLGWEQATLMLMIGTAAAYTTAAAAYTVASFKDPTSQSVGHAASAAGQAASSWASWASQVATFERRKQDWQFQRALSMHDVVIADQGITIAEDLAAIASQERDIAALRSQFAEDAVSFLTNQFFNQELYGWMARTLSSIYRQYLNTAISVARMAQQALSFERQEPISLIMPISEYWKSERKGLLAAELLELDIAKLDSHRANTEQRKRELTKVISLASAAPSEFQRLRDTGIMEFTTLLAWFDRDFPGHYMRLIKSLSLTFIALIPPTEGVHATLSNTGLSRIITGPPFAVPKEVLHQPEAVSLTVPANGTGLFEVNLNDPMLLPFEGRGVETSWTLELLPATNQFDFSTLADVLMTIRYTALDDWGYRKLLLERIGTKREDLKTRRQYVTVADNLQSFYSSRHRFADEWYDFNNPQLLSAPPGEEPPYYTIRFDLRPHDFPPNRTITGFQGVTIVVGGAAPSRIPVELSFTPAAGGGPYIERGEVIGGQLAFSSIPNLPQDTVPTGTWAVRFRNEAAIAENANYAALFTEQDLGQGRRVLNIDWVTDILLVVKYNAETRYPI